MRRGGELWQSYSTVQSWKKPYSVPAKGLSVEEEVEALVEGGGRWKDQGWRSDNGRGPKAVKFDAVVFEKGDPRLLDRVGGGGAPVRGDMELELNREYQMRRRLYLLLGLRGLARICLGILKESKRYISGG